MNKKSLIAVGIALALAVGTLVLAQTPKSATSATADPRIDKVLEQNEQILKNQQEILKMLGDLQTGVNVLKRRST